MSKLNVGDEVMMIEDELHTNYPHHYPAKGSIGVVVQYIFRDEMALVDWGQDSGVDLNEHDKYAWWCSEKYLEKVNANTQKEVYNMNKFNVGDKVVFTNGAKHERMSRFYPAVGSIGIVRDRDDGGVLIDWDEAEGVYINGSYVAKARWCEEEDIKLCEYTDDEVWEMLKPKMRQFVRTESDIYLHSPTVKNMVVAAYRSGYGRATKGRSFIIKPKVDEKPSIEKSIDDVLSGKMIVTIYYTDLGNSYTVSEFDHALHSEIGMEIHSDIIYDSDGSLGADGFDVIGEPDCEMYVAIPFCEAVGRFDKESIKVMYYAKLPKFSGCIIKQYAIGKYIGTKRFGIKDCMLVQFKTEYSNDSVFYPEIHSPDFKALVPIRDYLKHEGVNV